MASVMRLIAGGVVHVVMKIDSRLIQHVSNRRYFSSSDGKLKTVYDQVNSDLSITDSGISTLTTGNPDLCAAFYTLARENFFSGTMDRSYKEAIASTTAAKFNCRYCFSMHTLFLDALANAEVSQAIMSRNFSSIADESIRRYVVWTDKALDLSPQPVADCPFTADHRSEVLGLIAASATLGRVAKIFLTRSPLLLNQTPIMRLILRILRPGIRAMVTLNKRGSLFGSLPNATHAPDKLKWASGDAVVSTTFAKCDAVFSSAAAKHLSATEQQLIVKAIADWTGKEPPLGPNWLAPYMQSVSTDRHDLMSYALTVAAAPHRITRAHFETLASSDAALVIATWVSFNAGVEIAMRIASQM